MLEKLELTKMAQALAAHSGARLGVIARNMANSDTPDFRAQDLPDFAAVYESGGLQLRATRHGHFGAETPMSDLQPVRADDQMAPNGNSVSIDVQMMKAAESRSLHEMALAVYRSTSGIVRTSLGRSS